MTDFCNRQGALKLKAQLQQYWAERGYDVKIKVKAQAFNPAMREISFNVRSDMVNGMPRRKL